MAYRDVHPAGESAQVNGLEYRREHGLIEFSFMADINAGYDLIEPVEEIDMDCLHSCGLGDTERMWEEPEVEYEPTLLENLAKEREEAVARHEKARQDKEDREKRREAARRSREAAAKAVARRKAEQQIRDNRLSDFSYVPNPNNAKVRG